MPSTGIATTTWASGCRSLAAPTSRCWKSAPAPGASPSSWRAPDTRSPASIHHPPCSNGLARGTTSSDVDAEFIEGSLAELALEPGRYGFVLVPADVFLYCENGEDQLAWLARSTPACTSTVCSHSTSPAPPSRSTPIPMANALTFSGEDTRRHSVRCLAGARGRPRPQTRWLRVTYEAVSLRASCAAGTATIPCATSTASRSNTCSQWPGWCRSTSTATMTSVP